MVEPAEKIGVEAILELTGTDREAKSYAFLYAALKRTEISANPVRDVLDCLIPFTAPYINRIAGTQVTTDGLQKNLKSNFGFDIPLYAIDQLMPALQKAGYVEYRRVAKCYIARKGDHDYEFVKAEIASEFDKVVGSLERYATIVGFEHRPPSGGWGDALIRFLKSSVDGADSKIANIKGVLLEPMKIESAIVGAFIKNSYENDGNIYSNILNIFMGILVEEFISSVSEIGSIDLTRPVNVFFDTAVLLRLLGCSGNLLRTATEELARYLQDLGFKIFYLSGNESEVAGIFDTIIHVKDTGKELEGETAAAIASGDVSMSDIRMLQNTFPERLAAMGVFPAEELEKSAFDNAKYQIDERGFSEYLKQNALRGGRGYSLSNRENDAGYLGAVMRLRRRLHTPDLASCGYVFVTSNKFLAHVSRRYLIDQRVIRPQHCPPMLAVGQVATILWLMKDQALEPDKAGRELLSNCYAAFRPDQQWFRHFREGIERTVGNIEEYVKGPRHALTLQAARRIAQEESFGESAVVRELNMAEILSRADDDIKQREALQLEEFTSQQLTAAAERDRMLREAAEERISIERAAEAKRIASIEEAKKTSAIEVEFRLSSQQRTSAFKKADGIIFYIKIFMFVIFIILSIFALYMQINNKSDMYLLSALIVIFVPNMLSFADLLDINIVHKWFDLIRDRISRYFLS